MRASARMLMIGLALAPISCAAIFGFERLSEESADAATPTEIDGAASVDGGDPSCGLVGVPPKPELADASGTPIAPGAGDREVFFAVRSIDLATPRALNLDRACTTTPASSTCILSADPQRFPLVADGDGGRDMTMAKLFPDLGALLGSLDRTNLEERIRIGRFGFVIRLGDWNGTSEDERVLAQLHPALGLWDRVDGGLVAGGPPGDDLPSPRYDSADLYMVDKRFDPQIALPDSKIRSILATTLAYVANGTFVAFFGVLRFPLRVPRDLRMFDIVLRDAWLVGRLTMGDAGQVVLEDGVFSGRWSVHEMFSEVLQMRVQPDQGMPGFYLCEEAGRAYFAPIPPNVCPVRDLRTESKEDDGQRPCEAISTNIGIETYAVDGVGPSFDQTPRYIRDGGSELLPDARCLAPVNSPLDAGCPD